MYKILYLVTAPQTTGFLRGHLAYLKERGFEPIVCSSPGPEIRQTAEMDDVEFYEIPMQREISLLRDVVSLWRLFWLIRKIRPTIVVAVTPKAGFLGMLAGFFLQIPIRVRVVWGIRFETIFGLKRQIVWFTDKIAMTCSHRIFCDSESGKSKMNEFGLATLTKIHVPAHGSANGINPSRFQIDTETINQSLMIRQEYGIPPGAPIIGFIGRIVRDKGIVELVEAYKKILTVKPDTRLIIVGPSEIDDSIPKEYEEWLASHPQVVLTGPCQNVIPYYNIFDLFVLPSYREGFGVVVLEAAAMGVPTVGFNATGVVDSIVDGQTGTIVPMKDTHALTDIILKYLDDPDLKAKHGINGRKRVVRDFQPPMLWEAYYQEYCDLLQRKNLPIPVPVIEPEPIPLFDPNEDEKEFLKWYAIREIILRNQDIMKISQRFQFDIDEVKKLIKSMRILNDDLCEKGE